MDGPGTGAIDALLRDTRHALRRLARDWRFTAAAVLMLGLGIGVNTAIFSLINATLFRQQSFADPDRLVDIYQNGANPGGVDANSYPAYLDMAAYTDVFASTTAVFVPRGVNYLDEGAMRPAIVEHTTAAYPSVLGLRPSLGRWFNAAEDTPGAAVVAVVGHEAWTRKFRADPSVVGRAIRIEGVPVTIVGVGPSGHRGTINLGIVTDFWLPISSLPALGAPPRTLERRPEEAAFFVKARLRDGVTVAQAQAAMSILGARLATEHPQEDPGKGIAVFATSDVRIHPQMDAALRSIAFVLLGVVGLVLAIACSNLATLLLVRGAARAKEVSVRLALGATRGQLVRHLLMESLLLSAAGGIAGCLLAWWTIRSLGRRRPADRRRPEPRLPGPRLRPRPLSRHRRRVRPRAGARGHEDRSRADAARRRRDAIDRPALAHAQECAGRVPGGGVGRAARRNQHLRSDARRLASAARRLCD
jgi:predicted permease